MNITNAKYHKSRLTKENISISCIIDGTHLSVPLDPNNTHYAEIMRQVDAGDLTIEEAD